jgi:hypothetical protein
VPKEITHWWLASEVLAALKHPLLSELLERNKNIFLLGSVGPDFLFYYLHGPEEKRFREAAMVLHGSDGNDTLAILVKTADAYSAVLQDPAVWSGEENGNNLAEGVWAFLFGYVCHVAADSVFHPLVLYCAGKGDSGALYKHYLFESVLDLYVTDVLSPGVPRRLKNLSASMEMDRKSFLKLLGFVSFGGAAYNREALKICLKRYESIQSALWSFWGRTAARCVGTLIPGLRHFIPSFYQKAYHKLTHIFGRSFQYQNPVTGVRYEHSVDDLRGEVVRQAVSIADVFENILSSPNCDPIVYLEKIHGPNLETGLYGDNAKKILYTDPAKEALFKWKV